MAKITVTVPDEVYRAARISAAKMGSSVSALVVDYLRTLSDREAEFERLRVQQKRSQSQIDPGFSASDRLSRDEVYERTAR